MQQLQKWRNNITCTICREAHPTAYCPIPAAWQAKEEKEDDGTITLLRRKEEWEQLESATEWRMQKNGTERMTDLLLQETPTTTKEPQQEGKEQETKTGAMQMDEGLELLDSQEEKPSQEITCNVEGCERVVDSPGTICHECNKEDFQDHISQIGMTQQIQEVCRRNKRSNSTTAGPQW